MATKIYRLDYSQPRVHSAIKRAVLEIGWRIKEESEDGIIASTPSSILSWGETIEVRHSSENNQTILSVTSNPRLQIFDWGKGEENIKVLLSRMTEILS